MYDVLVLSDAEFEKLPFDDVTNPEVCGCADPSTNVAYVRKSLTKGMRLLTIDHELNELTQQFSPHEKNGIRYGWFKKLTGISTPEAIKDVSQHASSWVGPAATVTGALTTALVPGLGLVLGPAIAGLGNSITNYQETGDYTKAAISGALNAGAAYAGGSMLSSGLNAAGAASTSNVASGGLSYTNPFIAGVKGAVGLSNPATTAASAFKAGSMGTGALNTGIVSQAANGMLSLASGSLSNPLSIMGLTTMGLSAMPISVAAPNIGAITSKWLTADSVTKAGEAAKKLGESTYLTGTYTPSSSMLGLVGVLQGDIDKAYKDRAQSLDRAGLASSDSWMSSGERLELLQKLDEERMQERSNVEKELLATDQQTWAQNQYNYIMNAISVDDQTKQDLLYADIADVTTKYQVKANDVMQIRDIASKAGLYMLASGLGLNK